MIDGHRYISAEGGGEPRDASGDGPRDHLGRELSGDGAGVSVTGSRKLRIALAHDWLCGYRGGEAVLERIAGLIRAEHEAAGLWVMFDDGRKMASNIDAIAHHVSIVGRMPMADRLRRWMLPAYPFAVDGSAGSLSRSIEREHRRKKIDLLISTSSAAVKGIRPPAGVPHLCYCHSPARYVWSRAEEYAGGLRGLGLRMFAERFKAWDVRTAANVTRFIANSNHVAGQIREFYDREAEVVWPPVRTEYFTPGGADEAGVERESFWLVVGALEPYKRVDLAIDAARLAGRELVVIGSGSQREELEARAAAGSGDTKSIVRFLGRVPDEVMRDHYRRAEVLLFPQVEDFGIIAVEAQACGLPVVARGEGGALDTVIDGVTGSLFDEPTAASVVDAMARCPRAGAASTTEACRKNALRFAEAEFDEAMREQIGAAVR